MRRYAASCIAGSALILAACRDAVEPTAAPAHTAQLSALDHSGVTSIRGNRRTEDDAKAIRFELRPGGGRVRLGGFELEYPAHAVCDPSTSGYGPDTWKTPCETLTKPITMTGKVWVEDGMTFVDVGPDIRFDPSKDVYMSVKVKDIMHQRPEPDWTDRYGIWYTTRVGDERFLINDAVDNPELRTLFETTRKGDATGWMTRKIWHFSGYYVRAGRVCDTDCDGDSGLQ